MLPEAVEEALINIAVEGAIPFIVHRNLLTNIVSQP
jgi:hypothetical protein